MPMPISISSSPSSKVGLPAAGTVQDVSAMPMLRPLALTLRQRSATRWSGAPAAAARDDANLADHRRIGAHHDLILEIHSQEIGVSRREAGQLVFHHGLWTVDQLLHAHPPHPPSGRRRPWALHTSQNCEPRQWLVASGWRLPPARSCWPPAWRAPLPASAWPGTHRPGPPARRPPPGRSHTPTTG